MTHELQFDPALKQILLRAAGDPLGRALSEEAAVQEVPVAVRLNDPAGDTGPLRVVARFGKVVTGRVELGQVMSLHELPNIASVKATLPVRDDLATSTREIGATPPALARAGLPGLRGRGVIIGVADWGCDFAHANFCDETGRTRLLALWDQRGPASPSSPVPYGYGREYTREQINGWLAQPDPYACGYDTAPLDPAGRGLHGTHVLDIAAGNGRAPEAAPGVAPGADLIFVHLRGDDTTPLDTLGDSVRLLEAVHYICQRAGDRPVVINLSMGKTGGYKDGCSLVEQALDALLLEAPGRAIVMSTGNYYDAALHASGQVKAGQVVELPWQVATHNDEMAEVEVWYSNQDAFRIEVVDPYNRLVAQAALGETHVVRDETGQRVLVSLYHRHDDPNSPANQIDLFLWPDAPVGVWTLRLIGERVTDGHFHAWIERESPAVQSRFNASVADPTHTTNTICNGRQTIAVGAYDTHYPNTPLVSFSSSGPSTDGRQVPLISAPGAAIWAAKSSTVDALGQRARNELTPKSGSSMAAPHVAGVVALMFEAALPMRLTVAQVRQILTQTARRSPPADAAGSLRYGAGRVDAAAAAAAASAAARRSVTAAAQAVSAPKTAHEVAFAGILEGETSMSLPPADPWNFPQAPRPDYAWTAWPPGTAPAGDMEGFDSIETVPDLATAEDSAIVPFTPAVRAALAPILRPEQLAAAVEWNARRHPAESGVSPEELRASLASYVDLALVQAAVGGVSASTRGDIILAEAIHQFQVKVFAEPSQADGLAGPSTLDSLGFIPRSRFNPVNQPNRTAQATMDRVAGELSRLTSGEFTAANWWQGMVNPGFLGYRFTNGIHLALLRRLRLAEQFLLSLPPYQGKTPVEVGRALGLVEGHKGARPTSVSYSMHTFGLAVDINYAGNPWVSGNPDADDGNQHFSDAFRRAAGLVGGVSLPPGPASVYFHSLSSSRTNTTAQIYDILRQRDTEFRLYLRLDADRAALARLLQARQGSGGVFAARPGESLDQAIDRWLAIIRGDQARLNQQGNFTNRDPRLGFFNLNRDLVLALREHGGLAWGAVDFGRVESGDMMHFDLRLLQPGLLFIANRPRG